MALNYYVLDTETTGLKAGFHEINQLSILRVSDGFQRTWNIRVAFPQRASEQALAVQKKTKYDLLTGLPVAIVAEQVDEFFEEDEDTAPSRCIIGHNIAFDRRFCHHTWMALCREFKADLWLCTQKLMRKYSEKVGLEKIAYLQNEPKAKFGLSKSLEVFKIAESVGAHSATVDVRNNLNLYNRLISERLDYLSIMERLPHKITGSTEGGAR